MRATVTIVLFAVGCSFAWMTRGNRERRSVDFAHLGELNVLRKSGKNRLFLGKFATPRWAVTRHSLTTPQRESVLILGPTQSGKTSSLVLPALLTWEGPLVAASVKDDLVRESRKWRTAQGPVAVLDPSGVTDPDRIAFDPVVMSTTWQRAQSVAASLMEASFSEQATVESQFWSHLATKFLSPLLFAAAESRQTISDVLRWINRREIDQPLQILERVVNEEPYEALVASLDREERQRSSLYATVESALEPLFLHDDGRRKPFHPEELLTQNGTLYLCATAHDQTRYRPMFTALITDVIAQAFALARKQGGTLREPLLIVLDEAAAIAPLRELDVLAATCASHGITLMTCFQDLAQIRARYGERWGTVVNNHRTRLFLSGLADPEGGALLQSLSGTPREQPRPQGLFRTPASMVQPGRALIEPNDLRRLKEHRGIVIRGSLPPIRLTLEPWWSNAVLSHRGNRMANEYAGVHGYLRRLRSSLDH
jgi:type IV secretory pathway TraG/TraD family ATPase VirD4